MSITFTKDLIDQSKKPIVMKAFATWCPHCSDMKPIFNQLEKELPQFTFAELDIDQSKDLATEFDIKSLPTFIFIKNKKEVGRILGEMTKEELQNNIEKYLK